MEGTHRSDSAHSGAVTGVVDTITPSELAARTGDDLILLDVREKFELEISRLPNIVHIPLSRLPTTLGSLDKDAEIIVICRTGRRSGHATDYLRDQGFRKARNLVGGMNAWARDVDPNTQTY